MLTTEEITVEVLKSITVPLLKRVQSSSGFKPCSEEIIKGISNTVKLEELELYQFIDHVKQYVAAIKIAYRFPSDKRPFNELIGRFLEMFENIGGFNAKKYNKKIDEFVCTNHDKIISSDTLNIKIEKMLEMALEFTETVENEHAKRKKYLTTKRSAKADKLDTEDM
ncbi:MAG: hypothetical protein HQK88_16890 [Nitrospirae bacterium]|nr:hypothetical protein [Nitrospirota bacterium]MBF0536550.1 hypothetical protein [Nitrospirota bacterium]MBF0618477.1 hypothetical protein [Nitrospirota bacterium]